jgi:superfamily II DNA/RNA helicase
VSGTKRRNRLPAGADRLARFRFSATWPPEVRQLAEKYLKNATRVTVGQDEIIAAKAVSAQLDIGLLKPRSV